MVKITVCIGSSCHLKGSRQIVERFQYLIKESGKDDAVELAGAFCMGKCASNGVSVTVDGDFFAVKPEDADEFFRTEVLPRAAK
ncbi:MAG: (2Fe-2S) ferredoxin domain-containing protein [Christensenellales bacterium]